MHSPDISASFREEVKHHGVIVKRRNVALNVAEYRKDPQKNVEVLAFETKEWPITAQTQKAKQDSFLHGVVSPTRFPDFADVGKNSAIFVSPFLLPNFC
mmetsp:Transcript_17944/g.43528  ORF Transcript_17944/g.43528 Transcript_17944/m.43528 type:complete len:99 (-) Transcript_17944:338-634(-)